MAKLRIAALSVLCLGAQGAVPPHALEPLAMGAAMGFISDKPDVMVCGMALMTDVGDLKAAFEDIKEGVLKMNKTDIEEAVKEIQAAIDQKKVVKTACDVVKGDVKTLMAALKDVPGPSHPKNLTIHILSNFFDDGEKIFGQLAASEHAYKTGWDYMTSGEQLGMALRRMLVGELNGTTPLPPAPPHSMEPLLIGMAEGFISDSPDVMACGMSLMGEAADMKTAMADLKRGITGLNLTEIKDGLEEIIAAIDGAPSAKATCNVVRKDVTSIIKVIKQMKGPKDLVIHIVGHMFDDGENIFGELSAAIKAYKTGWDFMTAGQQLGMAFRRMLVGEAKAASTTSASPSSLVVV